jgi:hypothetical protein
MKPIFTILDKNVLKHKETILVINQKDPRRNGIGQLFMVDNKAYIKFANGEEGEIKKSPFWSKLFSKSKNN